MKKTNYSTTSFLLLTSILFVLFISGCSEIGYTRVLIPAQVIQVIDGDTIVVANNETSNQTIRFLGINTPEKNEPCYEDAKAFVSDLVFGKVVYLERDKQDLDQYNRKLRYIFLDEKGINSLNIILLRQGLAKSYFIEPNTMYKVYFQIAEQEAISTKQGCLWKNSNIISCLDFEFNYDAEGNDCDNPNNEYFILINNCKETLNLSNWKIKNSGRYFFTFPDILLKSNNKIIIKSGNGKDNNNELFWLNHGSSGQCKAVWNNNGGQVLIYNNQDEMVLFYSY